MGEHIPVLLNEMLAALNPQDGGVYLDATFGGGGYTRAILDAAHCDVIALDRDPDAVSRADLLTIKYPDRFQFFQGAFSNLQELWNQHSLPQLDGIVFDFGVSSFQIDQPDRGFSFRFSGPLDMRMSKEGISAADVVNTYSEKDLVEVFSKYGEVFNAKTLARKITAARREKKIRDINEFRTVISECADKQHETQYYAKVFQALRIEVNDELESLKSMLAQSVGVGHGRKRARAQY